MKATNLMFKSTERASTEGIRALVGTRDGLFLLGHYSIHERCLERGMGWSGVGWGGGVGMQVAVKERNNKVISCGEGV